MCIFACCIIRCDAYGVWIYLFNTYNLSNWETATVPQCHYLIANRTELNWYTYRY